MKRKVTIALLDEIQDGFNRQDVDAILSHFTDDCVWLMARGPSAVGAGAPSAPSPLLASLAA